MHFKPDMTGGEAVVGRGTALGGRFSYSIRGRIITVDSELNTPLVHAVLEDDGRLRLFDVDQPITLVRASHPQFGAPDLLRAPGIASVRQWAAVLEYELGVGEAPVFQVQAEMRGLPRP